MDDLNKPLILDKEYSPKKNKNSDNLSNDEIQKKSFQLLGEEELLEQLRRGESILQVSRAIMVFGFVVFVYSIIDDVKNLKNKLF